MSKTRLYHTYSLLFNIFTSKIAGSSILSADISLLSSGLMRIPILPNTKSSKSMNSHVSKPLSNRTGSFFSNTIYGDTQNLSSLFKDATATLFQKTSSVLYVALPTTSSTITTAAMGNISARSAARRFPLVISLPLLFVCCALTAGTLS